MSCGSCGKPSTYSSRILDNVISKANSPYNGILKRQPVKRKKTVRSYKKLQLPTTKSFTQSQPQSNISTKCQRQIDQNSFDECKKKLKELSQSSIQSDFGKLNCLREIRSVRNQIRQCEDELKKCRK